MIDGAGIRDEAHLNEYLKNGPYVWPGGYPIYFEVNGFPATLDAVRTLYRAHKSRGAVGRYLGGLEAFLGRLCVGVNWEDGDLRCYFTGRRIESAYAEEDVPAHVKKREELSRLKKRLREAHPADPERYALVRAIEAIDPKALSWSLEARRAKEAR